MLTFDLNRAVNEVVVVGVGGTGAQVAAKIARICYDMRENGLNAPEVVLVDMDHVEQKNVGRQLFTPYDANAGVPKAEAIARRLNMAYGMDIAAFTGTVAAYASNLYSGKMRSALVVDCVDNYQAREDIIKLDPAVVVSCGNEATNGQVTVGTTFAKDPKLTYAMDLPKVGQIVHMLPGFNLLFPELVQPTPAVNLQAMSCAELTQIGQQHLLVNDLVATCAASYVYKLLHRQHLETHVTYLSVDPLVMRSEPITAEMLTAYGLPVP